MQKRKARDPTFQARTLSYDAYSYISAVPEIPLGSVVHMRYKTPTETARNLIAPMLQLGGEGKGPPVSKGLLQDQCPKLWSWFDNNCSTYGFVPLHRKENYVRTKGNGKRRDVNRPDILPVPDYVAYRYRSANNFSERQRVDVSRHVLYDSDEYFIEALTTWHKNRWFEVLGRGGEVLSPQDSVHFKVSSLNAMEEDHLCPNEEEESWLPNEYADGDDHQTAIDKELTKHCQLEAKKQSVVDDMFHSANDEGVVTEERVLPFYSEVQRQRNLKQVMLSRYHYYKGERASMLAFTSYVSSFKTKYVGPPGLPIPEIMKETEEIERELCASRHSACSTTVPPNAITTSFIGYEIGNPAPYYNNRLRLMGLSGYESRPDKIFNALKVRVRKVQHAELLAIRNKSSIKGLASYLGSLKTSPVSTKWKFQNVPSISKLLSFIGSFRKEEKYDEELPSTIKGEGIFSKVTDKYGNMLDYATPYVDGHLLYQKIWSEVDKVEIVSTVMTESIIDKHFGSTLPDTKWVDNLDLFSKRRKSFTKQIYIEPQLTTSSLNKSAILTFDKEGVLSANKAIVKEVITDLDLYNKILDHQCNVKACPTCGVTG